MPEGGGNKLEIYDIASGTTTTKTLPNSMNITHSALSGGKIYMPESAGSRLEIYDIASDTTTAKTLSVSMTNDPLPKIYNGKLYLVKTNNSPYIADGLAIYNIGNDSLETKTISSSNIYDSVMHGDKLYVIYGGSSVLIYSLAGDSIVRYATLPNWENKYASIVHDGRIYMPSSSYANLQIYSIACD
jgi:hypothetical protein